MALLTRASDASPDTSTIIKLPSLSGLVAGEDIAACDACYVSTDGLIYRSNGTAANAAAKVDGFAMQAAKAGQGVTLFGPGTRMRYGTGLTPSSLYYLGTTAGRLDTATTTGGTVALCKAITSTDVLVINRVP